MRKDVEIIGIPVVLLAGGLGTRLRSLFPDIPKVMAKINGKPFLEWVLLFLKTSGFSNFIVSCGYLAEEIEKYFKSKKWHGKIRFLIEDIPLGTGGAVIFASDRIKSKEFLVMNADSITLVDFKKFLKFYNKEEPDILIGVKKTKELDRYGIVRFDINNKITAFNEKEELIQKSSETFINAGIYLFSKKIFSGLEKNDNYPISLERDMLPRLIEGDNLKIMAFEIEGDFIDIGTPESFTIAEDFILKNIDKLEIETH